MAAVEGDGGEDLVGIVGGDLGTASTAHVQVDEARHHVPAREVVHLAVDGWWITGAHADDPGTPHCQPTRIQHPPGQHDPRVGQRDHSTPSRRGAGSRVSGLSEVSGLRELTTSPMTTTAGGWTFAAVTAAAISASGARITRWALVVPS